MASSRNPFFFCCFKQRCKPSLSPVFPAFTNLGQTGGTKGASNAIRCRFFRSPAQRFPLPPRRSGQHLLCVGRIFYFRCALPAAAKKRLGNAEIRLSLGTCFRQEAKLLACQLFTLLHASLPGVPDLPTLRHILIRHLSFMQGKKGREYGRLPRPSSSLPSWQMKDKKKSLPALFGTKHSPILGSDEFEEYPQRDKLPPGCDHIGNIHPQ